MTIRGNDSRVLATFTTMESDHALALAQVEELLEDEELAWGDENVLRMFNNYLIGCLQEREYDKGSAFADRLQDVAPANPHIYHNAACLYCFTGQLEKAMEQIRRGREHGGMNLMKLLADDDELAPIADRAEFLELVGKAEPSRKPVLPLGRGPAPIPYY